MSASTEYIILDIGTSWTKAFYVSVAGGVTINQAVKSPTSNEDLRFSTSRLIQKLKPKSKETAFILTSSYNELNLLAKEYGAIFVNKETVFGQLQESLRGSFENPVIFDGGASNFLKNFSVADVGAHLSFSIGELNLENLIGNRKSSLHHIPEDKNSLEVDEAILRASFSVMPELHNAAKFDSVVVTGGLFSWSRDPTRIALILLDLMAAGKVVQVWQDPEGFLGAAGALLNQKKLQAGGLTQVLKNLGALISLGGSGKVSLDWGLSEIQEISIADNEIALIPATVSQNLHIQIKEGEAKGKFKVSGGEWGIILDARPKPLNLEFGKDKSRAAVATWQQALERVSLIKI